MIFKFRINADHFASENARIYQIYIYIKKDASNYLYSYYEPDAANLFKTVQKIIDYFKQIYNNPHQIREARYEYRELKIKSGDIFFEF
jgi:hypothetical protein